MRSCTCSGWSSREHACLRLTANMQDFHQSAGKHLVRKEEEKKSRKLWASWRRWWQRAASLGCSCDQSGAEEKTFAAAIAHHGDRKVAHKEQTCTSKSRPPLTGSWANEIGSCISNKRRSGTLLPTYLPRAGAPRVRKRGPGSFSRPSAQVSASLDALFPDHFGAGETTAGVKPRNPCVCFLSSTPREKKKDQNNPLRWGWGEKGKISYSKTNSQVLEMLDWRAECASEMRAHLCRRCLLPLLHSGWVRTPRCSPPPSAVIGHVLGTGAVGGQRQQSNYWAMLSEEWI